MEGFVPRCAVCKGAHTAWSNACPARRKEMGRIEQAKQTRSIYWHVPSKDTSTRSRTRENSAHDIIQPPVSPISTRTPNRRVEETTQVTESEIESGAQLERQPDLHVSQQAAPLIQEPIPPALQEPVSDRTIQVIVPQQPTTRSNEENWATPATHAAPTIYQQTSTAATHPRGPEEFFAPHSAPTQSQPYLHPANEIDDTFDFHGADDWLDNMIDVDAEWLPQIAEDERSIPTSKATEPRATQWAVYKGCKCPQHQDIYSTWPLQDAELKIAKCMKVCVYCGDDFVNAAELRKHLKRLKYAKRNISVYLETRGKWGNITPGWITKPHGGARVHRRGSEPPAPTPTARVTRSQSLTHRTNAGTPPW